MRNPSFVPMRTEFGFLVFVKNLIICNTFSREDFMAKRSSRLFRPPLSLGMKLRTILFRRKKEKL